MFPAVGKDVAPYVCTPVEPTSKGKTPPLSRVSEIFILIIPETFRPKVFETSILTFFRN
jgi:hypothetical protein